MKSSTRAGKSLTNNSTGVADGRTWLFVHVNAEDIVLVTTRKRKFAVEGVLQGDLTDLAAAVHILEEYEGSLDLPGVDPVKDFKLNELEFVNSYLNAQGLQVQLLSSQCYGCPKLVRQYCLAERIGRVQQAIGYLKHALSGQSLTLFPDFQQPRSGQRH